MNELLYVWAWAAIGLAWVWVAVGQGILAQKSMDVMGKNPKMTTFFLTVTILWVALVESAAIYGLVVAFSILWTEWLTWMAALWSGLAIGFTGMWAWIWEGLLVWWALEAINRNPENKGKIMAFMVLFLALIEVIAIYGLIIAFQILWSATPVA
jgi:F0F1-type ATP synthase membrane subunit c/vacuolar-type H+-ATPase subunit K